MLIIISCAQNNTVKKELCWARMRRWQVICLAPMLKVTVQLPSPVVSGRENRQSCSLCTLTACCNTYFGPTYNQQEFFQWVWWGQDFPLARNGWPGQQQQFPTLPATLLSGTRVSLDLPIEFCRDRGGWQTWLHGLYLYLVSYKWNYTIMYLGRDFSLRNKY